MWRTEAEVALNDVVEAARESADMYGDDAEVLGGGILAQLFEELAGRRDRFAGMLGELVRRRGDLPSAPDADSETLHRLGNRLRAALSVDETAALLQDRLRAEEALRRLIDHALEQSPGEEVQALLTEFRQDTESTRAQLQTQLEHH